MRCVDCVSGLARFVGLDVLGVDANGRSTGREIAVQIERVDGESEEADGWIDKGSR